MFKVYFPVLVGIIITCHQPVLAQTDFREGYIVTHAKDTLTGYVDSRSETRNARQCEFKKTLSAEPVRYESKDILGYGFRNSKIYESREVKSSAPNSVAEQVFLELLVKGKISLYHFKEDGRYYVEKDNQGLTSLYQTDKMITRDGKPYIIEQKQYISILTLLMNDCPAVTRKIKLVNLEYNRLVNLVTAYNGCTTQAPSVKTKRKYIEAKAGLAGGVQMSTVRFSTEISSLEYLTGSVFPASTSPFGGLYLQTTLPWITDRFSIWSELHYVRTRYRADHEYKAGQEWNIITHRTVRDDIQLSFSSLRLPVLIRYTYPRGKLKPFVQAGGMAAILLNSSNSTLREAERKPNQALGEKTSFVYTSEEPSIMLRRTNLLGALGAGFEYRLTPRLRCFLECRGAMGNTMTPPTPGSGSDYKARTKIFSIQAGLGF